MVIATIISAGLILSQDFEGAFPPSGWVKLDLGASSSDGWRRASYKARSGVYSGPWFIQHLTKTNG